ncbi:MAG: DUF3780 domain-containing protein [Nitrospina sp.]|jgi:hypothetical protein|nr:DUF3780 domain-containing protein [Nitrospina sp.]
MAKKKKPIGFGFIPEESEHHFLVQIPKGTNGNVIIYERFTWQPDADKQAIRALMDRPKVMISKHKWSLIADALKTEFNKRLKSTKLNLGQWRIGQVLVEKLFGKEMVLLAWAVEDCDPSVIPSAIANWRGLSPEERWWLFTMTNASTGDVNDKRGWRKALRYALTENPVTEKNVQRSLFEVVFEDKLKREIK